MVPDRFFSVVTGCAYLCVKGPFSITYVNSVRLAEAKTG